MPCPNESPRHSGKPRRSRKSTIRQCMEDFDEYDAKTVGKGGSAVVMAVNNDLVVKMFPDGSRARKDLRRELDVFKHLKETGTSPHIVKCFGRWERGLILERADMTLRQRLAQGIVGVELENKWILEIAKGLEFLHAEGVLHGDFGSQNILVNSRDRAKICDFAGSKLGDKKAWAHYQVRNQHPKYLGNQPNVATEIFALGSVIYEITTGRPPYANLSDGAVLKKFKHGEFPLNDIHRPAIRDIVEDCWRGDYSQVSNICNDLRYLRVE